MSVSKLENKVSLKRQKNNPENSKNEKTPNKKMNDFTDGIISLVKVWENKNDIKDKKFADLPKGQFLEIIKWSIPNLLIRYTDSIIDSNATNFH